MGETIPPCINIIILGSVANLSIAGLFAAGILPAIIMGASLILVAILSGSRRATAKTSSESLEEVQKPPMSVPALIVGALIALMMMVIIFGGILGGIATPTEVSAFAVAYALIAGGLAFRQLTLRSTAKLFVDAASLSGMSLFIVAVAQMVAYILTAQQVPQTLAAFMTTLAGSYGDWAFLIVSMLILIFMGSVLEGAPALIIFGPLLIPLAAQLGIHPLHFGILLIIAMGLGLFAPPLGVGLYTACAVGKVTIEQVVRPSFKYLTIIFISMILIAFVPWVTLILPQILGLAR
jgi:tripartite ATP-independent transporter DctM subunit